MIETSHECQKISGLVRGSNALSWILVSGLGKGSKNARRRRRRTRLWMKDDRCRMCQEQTILPEMVSILLNVPIANISDKMTPAWRDRMATIDHVYSRFNPNRKKIECLSSDDESRTRLLCWKCNNDLSFLECKELELDEQRRRSGHFCRVCQSTCLKTTLTPIGLQLHHVKTVCLQCGAILSDRIRMVKHVGTGESRLFRSSQ